VFHVFALYDKCTGVVRASAQAKNFRNEVQHLMPNPPNREIHFLVERSYYGYSSFVHPLWKSIWGDANLGMRERYKLQDYRARVDYVDGSGNSIHRIVDYDFFLDQGNHLFDRFGHIVQIYPLDPNFKRKGSLRFPNDSDLD
jgi:hypothetical protein